MEHTQRRNTWILFTTDPNTLATMPRYFPSEPVRNLAAIDFMGNGYSVFYPTNMQHPDFTLPCGCRAADVLLSPYAGHGPKCAGGRS